MQLKIWKKLKIFTVVSGHLATNLIKPKIANQNAHAMAISSENWK